MWNPFSYRIDSELLIPHDIDQVWDVFTDFKNWGKWNTFMVLPVAPKRGGKSCRCVFFLDDGCTKKSVHEPEILVFSQTWKELRWRDYRGPLVSQFFRGSHWWYLEPTRLGYTRIVHGSETKGLLLPFIRRSMHATRGRYMAFNRALKEEVEKRIDEHKVWMYRQALWKQYASGKIKGVGPQMEEQAPQEEKKVEVAAEVEQQQEVAAEEETAPKEEKVVAKEEEQQQPEEEMVAAEEEVVAAEEVQQQQQEMVAAEVEQPEVVAVEQQQQPEEQAEVEQEQQEEVVTAEEVQQQGVVAAEIEKEQQAEKGGVGAGRPVVTIMAGL